MSKVQKHQSNTRHPALVSILRRLWQHISLRRRYQLLLMLILTMVSSFAEVVSLGAVLPFIGILTQPEKVFNSPLMKDVVRALNVSSADSLVLPLTIAFAAAALFAGGLRLLMLWVSIRLANAIGEDLSIEIYRRTLYQPYCVHIARNSSVIISGITQKVGTATSVMISLLTVFSSGALFAAILLTLLAIDPIVASLAVIVFGSAYGIIAWLTRSRLVYNSNCIAHEQTQVIKALHEGLGGIRDVLLDGTQAVYCDIYRKAIQRLQLVNGENTFINQGPRYVMEALGMTLIAALAYGLSHRPGGVGAALPVLGALALGAQRLLPQLQLFYGNSTVVAGSNASLTDVLDLLDQPLPEDANQPQPAPLHFQGSIRFDNVRFRYNNDGPWVLDGINLTIPRGARIGIVGSTGSGKSTALDLLMGLLEPSEGNILVDDRTINDDLRRAWQLTIAHVPQSIYLADSTIAENIAFGLAPEEVDMDRVRRAAGQARIADFVESSSAGYDAFVGERGIRLSGGQRQRIGIARALYKQARVLIFDEATSALDNITEKKVMGEITKLDHDLTILLIAHRLTTLQHCDIIVELANGKVAAQGTYDELLDRSPSFRKMAMTME